MRFVVKTTVIAGVAALFIAVSSAAATGPPEEVVVNGGNNAAAFGCSGGIVEGVALFGTGLRIEKPDGSITWVFNGTGVGLDSGDAYSVQWNQADHAGGYTEHLQLINLSTHEVARAFVLARNGEFQIIFEGCVN